MSACRDRLLRRRPKLRDGENETRVAIPDGAVFRRPKRGNSPAPCCANAEERHVSKERCRGRDRSKPEFRLRAETRGENRRRANRARRRVLPRLTKRHLCCRNAETPKRSSTSRPGRVAPATPR